MELFEEENHNKESKGLDFTEEKLEQKPEQNQAETTVSDKPQAKLKATKKSKPYTTQDKLVFGGLAVVGLGLILWVTMPSGDSSNQTTGSGQIIPNGQGNSVPVGGPEQMVSDDFKSRVSEILIKQKQQQDSDRRDYQQGMQILSQQLKVANERVNQLGQQLNDLRMNGAVSTTSSDSNNNTHFSYAEKALRGYSINDISPDLAWIKYRGQVYAAKQGAQVGNVIVTRIDTSNRIVYTNEGVIH